MIRTNNPKTDHERTPISVLFFGKPDDPYGDAALAFCQEMFSCVTFFTGDWGSTFPASARDWSGDLIISYLSRWVVPESLLNRAKIASINFHPGPPNYPGIGCINFALYNRERQYGATCHHMWPEVDTGPIISVRRVPVFEVDNVESLLDRTYDVQFQMFLEIGRIIVSGLPLPVSSERWTRQPYARADFNLLNRITPDMDEVEQARRIRACAYRQYTPPRTPD